MKKFISTLMVLVLMCTVIPIHSFANENDLEEVNEWSSSELNLVDDILASDFMTFKDMTDLSTYERSLYTYQKNINQNPIITDTEIQPYFLLRLLFSLAKSGQNYVLKVSKKGKTIKDVRNGKLEVDVDKHINAKNRFKDYGDIDKLVKYIVEDIRRLDELGLVKAGDNSIKTVYGKDQKLLEIRFHIKDGKLYHFNAFPNHSSRDLGNVVWLTPQ